MKARYPAVPWKNVADIGNVLRHAYPSLDHQIMWKVATRHVTPLRDAVEHMLSQVKPADED